MLRRPDESVFTVSGFGEDENADETHISEAIVASCESYGFAIVRNTFAPSDFAILKQESLGTFEQLAAQGLTRRYDSKEAVGVIKTHESTGDIPDRSWRLLGGLAMGVFKASTNARRMQTPDAAVAMAFVAKYEPRGKVARHRDGTTGVMCDTSLEGRALMGFWHGARKLGDVVLSPNDTVIMPARTPGNARRKLVRHDVVNITRSSLDLSVRTERYSLIYGYGRTRSIDVAKGKQAMAQ